MDLKSRVIPDLLPALRTNIKPIGTLAYKERSIVYEISKDNNQTQIRPLGLPSGILIESIVNSGWYSMAMTLGKLVIL